MTALILFAFFWGLFQLFAVATLSRTTRWRVLFLAFLCGMCVSTTASLVVQQAIHFVASTSGVIDFELDRLGSYTIDPFIEEFFKIVPLIIICQWKRVRNRFGIVDMLLLGAALGAGFGFAEITIRLIHYADRAIWDPFSRNWTIVLGLSTYDIPGVWNSLRAWLPAPLRQGPIFNLTTFHFLGHQFELHAYNYHLIWGALSGLSVGLFYRLPRRFIRLFAVILLIWVGALHAFENCGPLHCETTNLWALLISLAAAVGGFGKWMSLFALLGLLAAIGIDRNLISQSLDRESQLKPIDDKKKYLSLFGDSIRNLPIIKRSWQLCVQIYKFVIDRREFAFLRSSNPQDSELAFLRETLALQWKRIRTGELLDEGIFSLRIIFQLIKKNKKFGVIIVVQLILAILFLIPTLIYLVVSVFPSTKFIQDYFRQPIAFGILIGLLILGLIVNAIRIFFFYRLLPAISRLRAGQSLARYLLAGIIAQGAFVVGLVSLAIALQGGFNQQLLSLLDISLVAELLDALDLIIFVFAVISLIGFELPILLVVSLSLLDAITALYTIHQLHKKSLWEDLNRLERIEYSLAIFDLLMPIIDIPLAFWKVADALDTLVEWFGVTTSGAEVLINLFQDPQRKPYDPWSMRTIPLTFRDIRRGDLASLDNQWQDALDLYIRSAESKRVLSASSLTKAAIMIRIAEAKRTLNDVSGAIEAYQGALEHYQRANIDPGLGAIIQSKIGDLQAEQGDDLAAVGSYQQAIEQYQISELDGLGRIELMIKIGERLKQLGDIERALNSFRRAFSELLGVSEPSIVQAELFEQIGDGFTSASELIQAAECYQEALVIYRALGSPRADILQAWIEDEN